jgi:hypothetical protein
MQLNKILNNTYYFTLSDNRVGIVYPSGYVRVTTKSQSKKLYQINKKIKVAEPTKWNANNFNYKRVLVNNLEDRVKMLFEFNQKNCI